MMNATLAYRILTLEPLFSNKVRSDPRMVEGLKKRTQLYRPLLQREVKVSLDNVARYYADHERTLWEFSDIPNWAPPFSMFFVEWNEPKSFRMEDGVIENHNAGQVGYQCLAADFEMAEKNGLSRMMAATGLIQVMSGKINETVIPTFTEYVAKSRWLIVAEQWVSFGMRPFLGRPIYLMAWHYIFVDSTGRFVGKMHVGLDLLANGSKLPDSVISPLHILGLGISFFHCRNVSKTEKTIETNRRAVKQGAPAKQVYYVLNIEPMKQVLRTEGRSETDGVKKALHICRGHFATYTPEAPLFGKHAGTFYIPDHVRGSAEKGNVEKDYKIERPPNDLRIVT